MSQIDSHDVDKTNKIEPSLNITLNVSSEIELKKIFKSLSVSFNNNKKRKLNKVRLFFQSHYPNNILFF
jgi:hypothetical protein